MKSEEVVNTQSAESEIETTSPFLKGYIEQFMAEKLQANDVVTYSVVNDFYKRFLDVTKNSTSPFLKLQRNSV